MKRIVQINAEKSNPNEIPFDNVGESVPVFAKISTSSKIDGMVVKEGTAGWRIRLGGPRVFSAERFDTRRQCMADGLERGYQFFIED